MVLKVIEWHPYSHLLHCLTTFPHCLAKFVKNLETKLLLANFEVKVHKLDLNMRTVRTVVKYISTELLFGEGIYSSSRLNMSWSWMSQSLLPLSGCIVRQNVWLKVHWHSSSRSTYWLEKSGSLQAFSQDLKNGCPKCAIGRAQMSNLQGNIYEK